MNNQVNYNSASGTITAGGTAQTALVANANKDRQSLMIANPSDTVFYIAFGQTATNGGAGTIPFAANSSIQWNATQTIVPQSSISIYGGTTSKAFTILWA